MANDFKVRFYSGIGAQGPQGPKGDKGDTGATGPRGPVGYHYTPTVSSDGDLTWTNDGGLSNPDPVNLTDKFVNAVEEARASVAELDSGLESIKASVENALSAVKDAQDKIFEIEEQRDDIMESIAAAADLGTDTSLSTSGMAADAKAAGEKITAIENAVLIDGNNLTWEFGGINSSTGANNVTTSDTRIRTPAYIPGGASRIKLLSGYKYMLFGYNGDTFQGTWNGTTFVKSGNWRTGWLDMSVLPAGYNYRIVLCNAANTTMAVSDSSNLALYYAADASLTKAGKAADAYQTGRLLGYSLKFIRVLTSADLLSNVWEPGIYYFGSSDAPADSPTIGTCALLVFGQASQVLRHQILISTSNRVFIRYRYNNGDVRDFTMYCNENVWYIKNLMKLFVPFTIVKGIWTPKGVVRGGTTVNSISNNTLIQTTPGSVFNMSLSDGWAYTAYEGTTPTRLTMTYHLSRDSRFVAHGNYIGLSFCRSEDGEFVYTEVEDFDASVIMMYGGTDVNESGEAEFAQYTHDMPENPGQLNVVLRALQVSKIQYETENVFPVQTGGGKSVNPVDEPTGTEIEGIPYSSTREFMSYVPQAVSLHSFMTAIKNPNSYVYTRPYSAEDRWWNCRAYYGAVCSSLVAYAYGIDDVIPTTEVFATYDGFEPLPSNHQSPEYLKIGDCLNQESNHIAIVTDIVRSSRGRIQSIEITEAATKYCRSKSYTPSGIASRFFDKGFVAYRYNKIEDVPYVASPWVHVDSTETSDPVFSKNLSPRRGDKANWRPGETIEIDVLDAEDYTSYSLINVDTETTVLTATIPDSLLIQLNNLSAGRYKVALTDGVDSGGDVYFDIVGTSVTYTPTAYGVDISYSSSIGTPSAVYWCNADPDSRHYRAVRAFHVLTDAEVQAGQCSLSNPISDGDIYNGHWLMRMAFKTEFGLYASDLTEVTVLA